MFDYGLSAASNPVRMTFSFTQSRSLKLLANVFHSHKMVSIFITRL